MPLGRARPAGVGAVTELTSGVAACWAAPASSALDSQFGPSATGTAATVYALGTVTSTGTSVVRNQPLTDWKIGSSIDVVGVGEDRRHLRLRQGGQQPGPGGTGGGGSGGRGGGA